MRKPVVIVAVLIGGCLAAAVVGCEVGPSSAADQGAPSLVVTRGDPGNAVEARYTENGRSIVLRSRLGRTRIVSEVDDDDRRSLTALATVIVQGERSRSASDPPVASPSSELFANQSQLATTLSLLEHAEVQLDDALPVEPRVSARFAGFQHILVEALSITRRALVRAWSSQVARDLDMTSEEIARLSAIYSDHGRRAEGQATFQASTIAPELRDGVLELLGPERFARYEAHRRSWFSSAGAVGAEVGR
jgi:hypothetical protein